MGDEKQFIAEHYEILEKIGEGSLGVVYRVRDTELQEVLALKLFHSELSQSPALMNRFRDKIRRLRRLSSPGIITMHAFGQFKGQYFLVMEFIDGESLEDRLKRAPVSYEDAKQIMIGLCDCLESAHRAGLVHSNLKPGNIVISRKGAIKIIDFGFTTPEDIGSFPGLFDARYMAPEQVYPIEPTPAIDIYAMGIVFYRLLCGSLPFTSEKIEDLAIEHATRVPPKPSTILKSIPADADRLIAMLLQKEPEQRCPSVEHIRDILTGRLIWCDSCGKLLPATTKCPDCTAVPVAATTFRAGEILREIKVDYSPMRAIPAGLPEQVVELKKTLASLSSQKTYNDHCSYCGKMLPLDFPFCPRCFLDAPFASRGMAGMIVVTGLGSEAKRSEVVRFFKKLMTKGTINTHNLPPSQGRFRFCIKIHDDPERAAELLEKMDELGVQARLMDPDDLMEMIRFNSWWGPLLGLAGMIALFPVSVHLATIPMIVMMGTAYRNIRGVHLPRMIVAVDNLPGTFTTQEKEAARDLCYRLKRHPLLLDAYEMVLFQCHEILGMMTKATSNSGLFDDIIPFISRILEATIHDIDRLAGIEQAFLSTDLEASATSEAAQLSDDSPAGMIKNLISHHELLVQTLNSLQVMKAKVSSIMRDAVSYSRLKSVDEGRLLLRDVMNELTALEKGFSEIR